MKREIKFRGKRVDNGEWVYGSLVLDSLDNGKCSIIDYAAHDSDTFSWWEVPFETIGQFTGLVDKNGVEIYEGDRILYKSSIERGEGVIIFERGFCIQWDLSTVVSPSPSLISPLFYFGCSQEIQVIGKINA